MKESSAIKTSISVTPLIFFGMLSSVHFTYTLLTTVFSTMNTSVCWESGIMAVICYGFIAIRNFMENAHFENLNKVNNDGQ